jgi:hypothetical protein
MTTEQRRKVSKRKNSITVKLLPMPDSVLNRLAEYIINLAQEQKGATMK